MTNSEKEEMAGALRRAFAAWKTLPVTELVEFLSDALHAEGYRKQPESKITDEMVNAALLGYRDERMARLRVKTDRHWYSLRAAIEAALRVPVGKGEQ